MAHKAQLANVKYRNWVKAGLGIKYVKEGLEPFCDQLATQQHVDILNKVKQPHALTAVSCGHCNVRTLQPNHVRTRNKQCPLDQINCNCQYPGRKSLCPNNVCGAIYDEIIHLHASIPPAPYWKNTDARQWSTEPWSVAKCFINAPGYENKTKASEFDCPGLLHLLINNKGFQQHIKCAISISGTDVFSRVRKSRNAIFHSHTMELEDKEVSSYIDDMIELLEDEKELKHRQESKDAVINLRELKQTNFTISTADEDEILRIAKDAIGELQQIKNDSINEIQTTAAEGKRKLEGKGLAIKSEFEQKRKKIKTELIMKEAELKETGEKIKKELVRHKSMIQSSMTSTAETSKEAVTSKEKADFQEKLFKKYKTHVSKVHPLPRLHKKKRNVSDMYVSPWMTVEIYNKKSERWEEKKISTHKIFRNDKKPAKNIYVIGEAGSGKSTFCKMLVHFWCIAHLYQECSLEGIVERNERIVEEMKKFNFLFYVLLRHYSNCDSIEEMLKKSYDHPALGDILQNDSGKCLIVLDGLDEWNPESKHSSQFLTPGLPGRELDADYTIITTTRQWKFDALPISDSEVDKKIKLKGIDRKEIRKLTTKTVETLNDIYQKCKFSDECMTDLRSRQLSDLSHTPLVLQQLICLWFNDKLQDNSKCAIYRSMLDLFLEWKAGGTSEVQEQMYVINTTKRKTRVIQDLSKLAYETLFDKNKEVRLTFSSSTLSIPHDVIQDCLASGILKEERNVSLSESIQSSISFFHKSMQEYLAAEYIASQFRGTLKSQKDELDLTDVYKTCVRKYFGSCETVVDILEQSNVLIMLGGLEPCLLTHISEYIYNVTLVDKMVVEERKKLPKSFRSEYPKLIIDIQACVLMCFEEVMSFGKKHIADLYVDPSTDLLRYGHNIVLEHVLSIEINTGSQLYDKADKEAFYLAVKHLIKCDQLKVMKYKFSMDIMDSNERISNEVATIIETNVPTLETVSLEKIDNRNLARLLSILPEMLQLTSLHVMTFKYLPHDAMLQLCEFLNKNTNLQHIALNINCEHMIDLNIDREKYGEHMIDLSKHTQLQHVEFMFSSFCMVSCNTDNLETCKLRITSDGMMKQVFNSLYKVGKLKHLELHDQHDHTKSRTEVTEYRTDTENLIRLLPSLVSLSTLTLEDFTFTDNVIAHPCDMKNLKKITLNAVTMCMSTWCKFIDSLPELPQVVKVKTHFMTFTDETISGYSMDDEAQDLVDEQQRNTARQYVREKTNLFRVTYDREYDDFKFTTKKY